MINPDILLRAYRHMCMARTMAKTYESNRAICKYVHSTSRGHEAIQLATAFQLQPYDYVSPYYRDESLLLGLGFTPYELMLQLLAKGNDIFTGGREYYSHPNSRAADKPGHLYGFRNQQRRHQQRVGNLDRCYAGASGDSLWTRQPDSRYRWQCFFQC